MNDKLQEKPTSLGTYSIPNAALYVMATLNSESRLNLTPRHLYHWVRDGLAGGYLAGIRNRHMFINFRDLISLRLIAIMRAQGMKHADIMTAERVLREFYGCEYPFATLRFWTAPPRDIFVRDQGILLSASRYLQSAMDFFEQYIQPQHNMTFDMFGLSATWRAYDDVLLDPQIQYGEPCVEGTRIPTEVLYSFHKAGDSVDNLAYFYGIRPGRIEGALAWEDHLQKVAHRTKE